MCVKCDADYLRTMQQKDGVEARSFTIRRVVHLYHEGFTAAQISEFFSRRYSNPILVPLSSIEGFIEAFG